MTITANTGAQTWNTNGAWVGGVQPTAADDVVIPASAVVTIPTGTTVLGRSLTVQASGTLAFASTTAQLTLGDATAGAGNVAISISATATITLTGLGTIVLASTAVTQQTIATGGKTLPNLFVGGTAPYLQTSALASTGAITIAGSYTLGANLSTSRNATGALTLQTGGAFVDAGFTVTISGSSGGFTMTAGTLTKTGVWNFGTNAAATFWAVTGGTVSDTAGDIVLTTAGVAGNRTFAGGGKTYFSLTYTAAGSTGQLRITGSNTFGTINFSDVTNARSLLFTAGTTTTITTAFNVNGTAGKLMTVSSITAATHTLAKASGVVSCDYLSVDHSIAGGGASWYAGANSTDGGSNTGWNFVAPPVSSPNFLAMF